MSAIRRTMRWLALLAWMVFWSGVVLLPVCEAVAGVARSSLHTHEAGHGFLNEHDDDDAHITHSLLTGHDIPREPKGCCCEDLTPSAIGLSSQIVVPASGIDPLGLLVPVDPFRAIDGQTVPARSLTHGISPPGYLVPLYLSTQRLRI